MTTLEHLKHYFPTGTTEGELQLLQTAFVYDDAFIRASAPAHGSPRLLVGKKGAGKTALLEFLRLKFEASGIPVVLLRPDDFDTSAMGNTNDLATIKRATFAFLTLAVANKLSAKGTLATGHQKILNEAARAYDKGNLDRVQKLLQVLMPVGKSITGIDFQAMLPAGIPRPSDVASAIRTELGNVQQLAYLMIDDTDQIGAPRENTYLPRIWGLLLGVRRLAQEAPNLKCLVSLRTEVWRRLRWDTRGQRDQVDHFQPLVQEWNPGDVQIAKIWRRRLDLASGNAADPVLQFFSTQEVELPGTERQHRLWRDFLVKNARERPRDMIQLMHQLIEEAIRTRADRIDSSHMKDVIGKYSAERVDYLADEFAQDCESLKDVIRSLARLPNVISTDAFMKHLQGVPSAFRVEVRGRALQGDSREDAFVLWALLHEAGVVNALVPDRREEREFRHINHSDDAGLVSPARWNEMQGMQWEIHPAFRSFLTAIRENEAAAQGVSAREVVSRRRR